MLLALAMLSVAQCGVAQYTPVLSGGLGFISSTNGGVRSYSPVLNPLLAAPIGHHFLIESRAFISSTIAANNAHPPAEDHDTFLGLAYLQGDYLISPHLTIVGGQFLLPFGTYNERISPIWIENFTSGPTNTSIGSMSSGDGSGGMVRGSIISRPKFSISYDAYFSARSGFKQFSAKRSAGGRGAVFFPQQGLEIGFSMNRLLQGTHENFDSVYVWWEPKHTGLRIRSELNQGEHEQGYWIETDYRMQAFGGPESLIGRFEPVFRIQQTLHRDASNNGDGVSLINTQRADFGFNYNLPHNARLLTTYARQFTATGNNRNIWTAGLVYRFLLPTWKGK